MKSSPSPRCVRTGETVEKQIAKEKRIALGIDVEWLDCEMWPTIGMRYYFDWKYVENKLLRETQSLADEWARELLENQRLDEIQDEIQSYEDDTQDLLRDTQWLAQQENERLVKALKLKHQQEQRDRVKARQQKELDALRRKIAALRKENTKQRQELTREERAAKDRLVRLRTVRIGNRNVRTSGEDAVQLAIMKRDLLDATKKERK